MASANERVAGLLREYADLLEISGGGDQFRLRSYERAARAIAGLTSDISQLDEPALRAIPGVGTAIAGKILQIRETGTFPGLERLRAQIPDGVRELTRIPALGPKRAYQLYTELKIGSVADLITALDAGTLDELPGFGKRSAERLLHGIELLRGAGQRTTLDLATTTAERVVAAIAAAPGCERAEYAGSLRRYRETIGDIDVLAVADDSAPVMAALTGLDGVTEVIGSGPAKTSVRITTGGGRPAPGSTGSGPGAATIQVDLRVVPERSWGAALQYFTGSRPHNVAIRELAVKAGLKLSEYGLFDAASGKLIVSATEEEVYARLGLAWVPPPMRENAGEIAAARRGELPVLVTQADMRGDLHTHTDLTDGVAPLEVMAARGRELGYEYYAVTDHAPDLVMQRMTTEKMLAQREQLARLQARLDADGGPPLALLHGTELNIAPDGSVDWPEDFLAGFDVCVASVHSHFDQPRAEATRRLITACENPGVHVIGHPTGRRIGRRTGLDVDFGELFRACERTGTALEVNSHPERLDLPPDHIRAARDAGVKFAISTDAHSVRHLGFLRYGIGIAQRGWVRPEDVINTWPLPRLRDFLAKRQPPGAAG